MDAFEQSEKLRQSLTPFVQRIIDDKTRECFRTYKAKVVSAPDLNTGKCDVALVGQDSVLSLPYSSSVRMAEVGDMVWVATTYNSFRNAIVWQLIEEKNQSSDDQGGKGEKGDKGDKGDQGEKGEKGDAGEDAAKLVSQVLQGQDSNGGNIYLQTYDDGTTFVFTAPKGEKGDKGDAADNKIIKITTESGTATDEMIEFLNSADENLSIEYNNCIYRYVGEFQGAYPCIAFSTVSVGTIDPTSAELSNIIFYNGLSDGLSWFWQCNKTLPLYVKDMFSLTGFDNAAISIGAFKKRAARLDFDYIANSTAYSQLSDLKDGGVGYFPYPLISDIYEFPEYDTTNSYIVWGTSVGDQIQAYLCYSSSGIVYLKTAKKEWTPLNNLNALVEQIKEKLDESYVKSNSEDPQTINSSVSFYGRTYFAEIANFEKAVYITDALYLNTDFKFFDNQFQYYNADGDFNYAATFAFPYEPPTSENQILIPQFNSDNKYTHSKWINASSFIADNKIIKTTDLKRTVFGQTVTGARKNITLYRHDVHLVSVNDTNTKVSFSFISTEENELSSMRYDIISLFLPDPSHTPAYGYIFDSSLSSRGCQVTGLNIENGAVTFSAIYIENGILRPIEYPFSSVQIEYDHVTSVENPTEN